MSWQSNRECCSVFVLCCPCPVFCDGKRGGNQVYSEHWGCAKIPPVWSWIWTVLKFINSRAKKKKRQLLFGGHCASDISRTKPPMILMEPTWAWLVGEMNGGVVLGIHVGNQKPDARRPSRPLPHKEQEELAQRNAESKALVHPWQSSSCVDLSHVSWRELELHPEHHRMNCADKVCGRSGEWSSQI